MKRVSHTVTIERKIALTNFAIAIFAGIMQHVLLEQIFSVTNWAFLGNGNLTLSVATTGFCLGLFGGRKFNSIFLFMSGLEHYAYIVRRIFLLISLLVFLIFALSLPGGRNFILVCASIQAIIWLTARKLLSMLVKSKVRSLRVLIVSEKVFVSEFFAKNFDNLSVVGDLEGSLKSLEDIDIVLFHNFSGFDMSHFVFIAQLQSYGVTSGYISNEIRLQGWSGIQVLVGPHLMMINSSYINPLFIRMWKRVFDLIATFLVFVVLLPLLTLLALFLYCVNGRPVFFSQERVGRNGKMFRILKFRTLKQSKVLDKLEKDAEKDWSRKPKAEELVLLGRWMRRWSIDELPQLVNVISGHMSLVGPRPRLIGETDEVYRLASPVFTMGLKPGITGLWQISGRNEIDPQFALVLDKYYVDHWNPLMDLQILIKTLSAVSKGVGAK